MKKIICIPVLLLVFVFTQAQINKPDGNLVPKIPFEIQVGQRTTTVIVFPWTVKEADRGMNNLLASKVTGVENVIELKAAGPFADTTNLHVYTADGRVHSFIVTFKDLPLTTTYVWKADSFAQSFTPVEFRNSYKSEKEIQELVKAVSERKASLSHHSNRFKMKLFLRSVFYDRDIMLLKVGLLNLSNLSYKADWQQLYITDKKQSKRSSQQQLNINLIYSDAIPTVRGKQYTEWIIAIPKTTIADKKKLIFEVQEKTGGRHLSLEIKNKHLFRAKPI